MGLLMGKNLVISGTSGVQTLRKTYIYETAGRIYIIQSSMELSKHVVVQHHGLMTLTLDFQGQMRKKLYHRLTQKERDANQ